MKEIAIMRSKLNKLDIYMIVIGIILTILISIFDIEKIYIILAFVLGWLVPRTVFLKQLKKLKNANEYSQVKSNVYVNILIYGILFFGLYFISFDAFIVGAVTLYIYRLVYLQSLRKLL